MGFGFPQKDIDRGLQRPAKTLADSVRQLVGGHVSRLNGVVRTEYPIEKMCLVIDGALHRPTLLPHSAKSVRLGRRIPDLAYRGRVCRNGLYGDADAILTGILEVARIFGVPDDESTAMYGETALPVLGPGSKGYGRHGAFGGRKAD